MNVWGEGRISRREVVTRPFSIFSLRNISTQTPYPSHNNPAGSDVIRQVYGRQKLFWSDVVMPEVRPTVETSLYWPLEYLPLNLDYTTAAGTNRTEMGPPEGRHWLMLHLFVSAGENGNTKFSVAFLERQSDASGDGITIHRSSLASMDAGNTAVIGSFNMEIHSDPAAAETQIHQTGLRPLYIPPNWNLVHAFTGLVGGNTATIRAIVIELPENQPFGALAGTL